MIAAESATATAYRAAHDAATHAAGAMDAAYTAYREAANAYAIARNQCADADRALNDARASARRKRRADTWDAAWAVVDTLRPAYDDAAAASMRARDAYESADAARREAHRAATDARDALKAARMAHHTSIPAIAPLMADEAAMMAEYGRAQFSGDSARYYRLRAADAAAKLHRAMQWEDSAIGLGMDTGIDAAINRAYEY